MGLWSVVALVYVAVRTVIAIVLLIRTIHRRTGLDFTAQAISDAAAAVFIVGYTHGDFRAAIGWLMIPAAVYFVLWEGIAAAVRYSWIGASVTPESDAELIGGSLHWVWDLWGIAPAFLAGVALAINVMSPGLFTLPGTSGPLRCDPPSVVMGDTVTLRMAVPHGGELGVFTPNGTYFELMTPPAAGTVPPAERFESRPRLTLATESATGRRPRLGTTARVFDDTGNYTFALSEYRDRSVVVTCQVRLGQRAAR